MALNIKKLQTMDHPPVTSVELGMKVRRLTTEDSSRSDYATTTHNTKKKKKEICEKDKVPPIKKLDLI